MECSRKGCTSRKFIIYCTKTIVEVYCSKCMYHLHGEEKRLFTELLLEDKKRIYYDESSEDTLTKRRMKNIIRVPLVTKPIEKQTNLGKLKTVAEISGDSNLINATVRSRLETFKVPYIFDYENADSYRKIKHFLIESSEYKDMIEHFNKKAGFIIDAYIKNTMYCGFNRSTAINGMTFEHMTADVNNADYIEQTIKLPSKAKNDD